MDRGKNILKELQHHNALRAPQPHVPGSKARTPECHTQMTVVQGVSHCSPL